MSVISIVLEIEGAQVSLDAHFNFVPATPFSRNGHPDTWMDGEPAEIHDLRIVAGGYDATWLMAYKEVERQVVEQIINHFGDNVYEAPIH